MGKAISVSRYMAVRGNGFDFLGIQDQLQPFHLPGQAEGGLFTVFYSDTFFFIKVNVKPAVLPCDVKTVEFLPCRQVQAGFGSRIHDTQITTLHFDIQVSFGGIIIGGEDNGRFAAVVEDIIDDVCLAGGAAAHHAVHAEAHGLGIIAAVTAFTDQIVGDIEPVRALGVDGIAVDGIIFLQLVPAGGAWFHRYIGRIKTAFHVPDNVVVNQVHPIPGAFYKDGFTLLNAVEVKKGKRDTIDVNGTDLSCSTYRVRIRKNAVLDFLNALEDALQAMARRGTVWVPTLSTIGNLRGKGRFDETAVCRILESALSNVARFAELGGILAPGTDAGAWAVPHGCLTEYDLLRQALGERTEDILSEGIRVITAKF